MKLLYFITDRNVFTLDADKVLQTTIEFYLRHGAKQVDEHEYNSKVKELRRLRKRGLDAGEGEQLDFTDKGGYGRKCY